MRYPSKYVLVTDLDDEHYATKCAGPPVPINENNINDLGNQASQHMPLVPAAVLAERVWQDCVANPVIICPVKEEPVTNDTQSTTNSSNHHNNNTNPAKPVWDFQDPTHKATCICTK